MTCKWLSSLFAATLLLALAMGSSFAAGARRLSIEDRVLCQRRIEQVYWGHRTWPKENPGPKPAFDDLESDAMLRGQVQGALRMTALLDVYWGRPLTGEQLQAEIDRMVRHTKSPGTLRELFAALDDDPYLVAECLARPTLARREVEARFASDERIHGEQRAMLAARLAGVTDLAAFEQLDGVHAEETYTIDESGDEGDRAMVLSRAEWAHEIAALAASFDDPPGISPRSATLDEVPVGRVSRLIDRGDRFAAVFVRARSATSVDLLTVSWPKRSYADWAGAQVTAASAPDITAPRGGYSVVNPDLTGCTDDTWSPTPGSYVADERQGHTAVWTGTEMIVWGGSALSALSSGGRYNPATDSWIACAFTRSAGANVPAGRYYHTAVWTGTEMIVWGGAYQGTNGQVYLNTGGRYSPASDAWVPCSLTSGSGSNVPSARALHTAVWTGSLMIVWGGSSSDTTFNTGGRYDPASDSWSQTAAGGNAPAARQDHTAVWTGTQMIVWGGTLAGGSFTNTGARYNPSTNAWTATSTGTGAPGMRRYHTAVWTGTVMVIWGGNNGTMDLATGARYTPGSDSWQSTATGTNAPSARWVHTAIWTGAEMIVWGGYSSVTGAYLNTGGRYNPTNNTWVACSLPNGTGANVPAGRGYHSAVWTGTEMIVWGGHTTTAHTVSTGGRYTPTTDSWSASSLNDGSGPNVPSSRYGQTAIWTGAEMIVWGGVESANTGGRYDPATDAWSSTSLTTGSGANVPAARYWHAAIWTGTEMIVWGGYTGSLYLNTGGRYNPATDTWALCSLTTGTGLNVPVGRYLATAVWTGTEMIVWGGLSPDYQKTGGRYAPATDTWAACSLTSGSGANVPRGRARHSAIWTGTEMIVWGGSSYDGSTYPRLNDGGRYTPSTDTWAACSLTTGSGNNVPTRRSGHTAVWTGTEMIVWSGTDGSVTTNTGGAYDPATDAWVASSLTTGSGANVPSARQLPAAVWTGTEMIVWGGLDGTQYLSTGGRYSPASDSWAASTLTAGTGPHVPAARYVHTAIWTGGDDDQMIVFGGAPLTHSGGLYCARCAAETWYRDLDGDGMGDSAVTQSACTQPTGFVATAGDCDDGNASAWSRPGEALALAVDGGRVNFSWAPPASSGATSLSYDLLRSGAPTDFEAGATCVATGTVTTGAADATTPSAGAALFYLVRANDACPAPNGTGPLGYATSGAETPGKGCP